MMKDSAMSLAAQGFPVLPLHWPLSTGDNPQCSCINPHCKSVGKHPLTPHGVKDASTAPEFVTEWWDHYPSANIGIATGHVCDVIDIDGPNALDSYNELAEKFGSPRYMALARTGRENGWHVFTAGTAAPCWTGGQNGWPDHVDGKGTGGYVVAAPSLHASGRRYRWIKEPGTGVDGSVNWPQWLDTVTAWFAPAMPDIPHANGTSALHIVQPWQPGNIRKYFLEVVRNRIINQVSAAGEGSRWQILQTIGVWDAAGLVQGGLLTVDDAVRLCDELGQSLGLDPGEIARIPREMQRALSKRHTPIAPRASQGHADGLTATGPSAGTPDGPLSESGELERLTALYRIRALARDAARRQIARETLGEHPLAEPRDLTEFLAEQREHVSYRIDGLWPVGGRVILAAQFKAGKTTLTGNLIRCLADGTNFLGRYPVMPVQGRIVLLDTEMSTGMLHAWLGAQGIDQTGKVSLVAMRGQVSGFDITDEMTREHWTHVLKELNTEILILDCLAPVLTACGLDEGPNSDMGTFLAAFDSMLSDANISEALIAHHMGHAGERSRGASRLRDWPDAEWQLIREGQEDNNAPADAPRYFRAYGRDVDIPEQLLAYEPHMRWLTVTDGEGNRKKVREHRSTDRIVEYVRKNPGQTGRMITEMVGGRASNVRATLKELVEAGTLVAVEGKKGRANAVFYYDKEYRESISELETEGE